MTPKERNRIRWTIVILVWTLSLLSIAADIYGGFPWVGTVWAIILLAIAVATTIHFIVGTILGIPSAASDRGYPRWFMRFAEDNDEDEATRGHDCK